MLKVLGNGLDYIAVDHDDAVFTDVAFAYNALELKAVAVWLKVGNGGAGELAAAHARGN